MFVDFQIYEYINFMEKFMSNKDILEIAKDIVKQANDLRLEYAQEFESHVSYCAFFPKAKMNIQK